MRQPSIFGEGKYKPWVQDLSQWCDGVYAQYHHFADAYENMKCDEKFLEKENDYEGNDIHHSNHFEWIEF